MWEAAQLEVERRKAYVLQHGIQKVIIPYENIKDIEEIPAEQRKKIRFVPVRHVSEVLEIALLKPNGGRARSKETKRTEPAEDNGRRTVTSRDEITVSPRSLLKRSGR